jgi:hypothetical protein
MEIAMVKIRRMTPIGIRKFFLMIHLFSMIVTIIPQN